MAFISGFFNSVGGDRTYDSSFLAEFSASIVGNGVYPVPGTNLQVVEANNMQTTLKIGRCWINGHYARNTADLTLNHDVADGILKRIDRVVLRLDYLTREIRPVIKKGTNASSPVAPTLQRDAEAYELAVADVLINNGATRITQANITDTRLNSSLCGIVHGAIDQADVTTIALQYQSAFQQMTADQQQDFEDWFSEIQNILDENVAANLTSRVLALEGRGQVVYSGGKVKLIY